MSRNICVLIATLLLTLSFIYDFIDLNFLEPNNREKQADRLIIIFGLAILFIKSLLLIFTYKSIKAAENTLVVFLLLSNALYFLSFYGPLNRFLIDSPLVDLAQMSVELISIVLLKLPLEPRLSLVTKRISIDSLKNIRISTLINSFFLIIGSAFILIIPAFMTVFSLSENHVIKFCNENPKGTKYTEVLSRIDRPRYTDIVIDGDQRIFVGGWAFSACCNIVFDEKNKTVKTSQIGCL